MGSTLKYLTVSQILSLSSEHKLCCSVGHRIFVDGKICNLGIAGSGNGIFKDGKKDKNGYLSNSGKLWSARCLGENNNGNVVCEKLESLWDDGYGTQTAKDYLEIAKDMIRPDYGPPRWFCPIECGQPLKDSPVLLFLPGVDGLGMGLFSHHKALGKYLELKSIALNRVFEVRCMHIPVSDRMPYEGLVKFVEKAVRIEHASSSNKPIYLVAESFGGCLALSVAAHNPTIDLVIILVNPATSFSRSALQPMLPFLDALPDQLHIPMLYLLSFILGDLIKIPIVNTRSEQFLAQKLEKVPANITAFLAHLSGFTGIIPKDTFTWKLKMLKSAAAHANSRLHAVKAEVLVIASGKDKLLPNADEACRLSNSIEDCRIRHFKENGGNLLMEDDVNLLTIIKGTCTYRRFSKRDFISDFLPPSMSEFKHVFDKELRLFRLATSSVMFSTLEDGKIVRGLKGVPDKGPVLLVGYHMLFGAEIGPLMEEFLREKNILVHGVAHPAVFSRNFESPLNEFSSFDFFKVFGAVPASGSNLYKLLSTKSHILLYPGGAREALHLKGEKYKLSWPDRPEFVRMSVKFGAIIVPFGVVGEDDFLELFLDYDDMERIPFVKDLIKQSLAAIQFRSGSIEEVPNQHFFFPGFLPKLPGRFYFLFGKPIETKGRKECLKNAHLTKQFYLEIHSEIEQCIAYLLDKREEDPYRNIFERLAYRAFSVPPNHIPSFDP